MLFKLISTICIIRPICIWIKFATYSFIVFF